MEKEIWKEISGYGGMYEVSSYGCVRKLGRPTCDRSQERKDRKKFIPGHVLAQRLRVGYPAVTLRYENRQYSLSVHRLVAIAFIPNPNNLPCINHKNGVRSDYRIENLEWCDLKQNAQHALDTGLTPYGENSPIAKLTGADVVEVFKMKASGMKGTEIAKRFGVYKNTIYHILNGHNWKRFTRDKQLTA